MLATKILKIAVNTQGDSYDNNVEVYSADRPHLYYFTTIDCEHKMEEYFN
jgi:hypothetical protein